jgi:hypothetical protein
MNFKANVIRGMFTFIYFRNFPLNMCSLKCKV